MPPRPKLSEELKCLYREAARRVRPDLASSDEDREIPTRFTAALNQAFERGTNPA